MRNTLTLKFGALADQLSVQLAASGVKPRWRPTLKHWQRWADAVVLLSIAGLLTDGEAHRVRTRLMKRISAGVTKEAPDA